MKTFDEILFPRDWANIARRQLNRLSDIDAEYGERASILERKPPVNAVALLRSIRAQQIEARRGPEAEFTSSHERMSAFILRDLMSSDDDPVAS